MTIEEIEKDFQRKVSEHVKLSQEDTERFRVFTPFMFEDGDHLAVVLKKKDDNWVLSDEGHTYMHLSSDIEEKDLKKDFLQKRIKEEISTFNVQDNEGELILTIKDDHYGEALDSFVQALLRITDLSCRMEEKFGKESD